jgi:hypothetical protein
LDEEALSDGGRSRGSKLEIARISAYGPGDFAVTGLLSVRAQEYWDESG